MAQEGLAQSASPEAVADIHALQFAEAGKELDAATAGGLAARAHDEEMHALADQLVDGIAVAAFGRILGMVEGGGEFGDRAPRRFRIGTFARDRNVYAVRQQLSTMPQNSAASRLAPPTSAPSTSPRAKIRFAFDALTEPP